MNHADRRRIADALRKCADLLEDQGQEAERLAADWATPLSSSGGPGPRNSVSRPTETAALDPDPMAVFHAELRRATKVAYRSSLELHDLILRIVTRRRVENQRAGIGSCETCGRYCDATSDATRLRAGQCNACRMRDARRTA